MHSQEFPFISVIIPTYRDWKKLELCLISLKNQTYPASQIEILIVNNDPKSFPPTNLDLPCNAKILHEEKVGSYAARNRGLKEAKGEWIGFTDSDCIPEPDWITNAVQEASSQHYRPVRITGPVNLFRESKGSWLAWKFESITAFNQKHNVRNGLSVTANLFVRREVFDKVGVFDEGLFSGGDMAWNRIATQMDVKLNYSEKVVVNHPARRSMGEILKKFRRVFGGEFVCAKRQARSVRFTLGLLIPPVRYARVLISDGRSIADVIFACVIFWGIKLMMLPEILRLSFGGTPSRQ